jgi:hypothetical protein
MYRGIVSTYHGIPLAALGIDDVVQLIRPCSGALGRLAVHGHVHRIQVHDLLETL